MTIDIWSNILQSSFKIHHLRAGGIMIEGIVRESIAAWVVHNYSTRAIDCGIRLIDCIDTLSSTALENEKLEKSFFEHAHETIPSDPRHITEWAHEIILDLMEEYFHDIMQDYSFSFRSMNDLYKLMKGASEGESVIENPIKKILLQIQAQNIFHEKDLTPFVSEFMQGSGHQIHSIISSDAKIFLSNILKDNLENPSETKNNPYRGIGAEIEKRMIEGIVESFKSIICQNIQLTLLTEFRKREHAFHRAIEDYFLSKMTTSHDDEIIFEWKTYHTPLKTKSMLCFFIFPSFSFLLFLGLFSFSQLYLLYLVAR